MVPRPMMRLPCSRLRLVRDRVGSLPPACGAYGCRRGGFFRAPIVPRRLPPLSLESREGAAGPVCRVRGHGVGSVPRGVAAGEGPAGWRRGGVPRGSGVRAGAACAVARGRAIPGVRHRARARSRKSPPAGSGGVRGGAAGGCRGPGGERRGGGIVGQVAGVPRAGGRDDPPRGKRGRSGQGRSGERGKGDGHDPAGKPRPECVTVPPGST